MPEQVGRHLAAVVFTDLVGYTALMQEDEAAGLAARARHRAALQKIVPAHNGRVLQFMGDGSMCLFPSSVSAVAAAIELQAALQEDPPLPLRIGIDEGEVAYDDQGPYGHCVNVASRIEGLARAGTVFVSEKVFREIENQPAFVGSPEGEFELKNVDRPVRVYSIRAREKREQPVELRLLGGVSLKISGAAVTGRSAQRRRMAFLALLSAAPHGVMSRDKIVGYLWPDTDPLKARRLLSEALYVVRKALAEDAVLAIGEELRLNPDVVWSDVEGYRAALDSGDLDNAVELYEGPFLDGFYVDGATEFDRWASATRERLAREYADALRQLADAADARADWGLAVRWWRRLIELDPFDAGVAVRYMQALEAAGRRAEALQFADTHARLLKDEFDAQPNPEVGELARRLRESPARTGLARDSGLAGRSAGTVIATETARPPQGVERPTGPSDPQPGPGRGPARWGRRSLVGAAAGIGGVVILVAVWGITEARRGAGGPDGGRGPASGRATVAVMPFLGDADYGGLWSALSDLLSDAGDVTSIPYVNVRARVGAASPALTPDSAARVAARLPATHFVLGEVGEVGGSPGRLSFYLYEVGSDQPVLQFDRTASQGRELELAEAAAFELLTFLSASPTVRQLGSVGTTDIEAFRAFKAGERAFRATEYSTAAAHFARAVEIDPEYAMGYYRLSQALEWDERFVEAAARAEQAETLSRGLSDHDRALVRGWNHFLHGEAEAAEAQYQRVLEVWPEDVEALYGMSKVQLIFNPLRGRSRREALPWLDRLFAVSPGFGDGLVARMELAALTGDRDTFDSLQALIGLGSNLTRTWAMSRALSEDGTAFGIAQALDSLVRDPLGLGYVVGQLTTYWNDPQVADALTEAFLRRPETRSMGDWAAVATMLSGALEVAQGRFAEGVRQTRQARDQSPGWSTELEAYYACHPYRSDRQTAVTAALEALEAWTPSEALDEGLNELLIVHQGLHAVLRTYLLGLVDACGGRPELADDDVDALDRVPRTEGQGPFAGAMANSLRAHQAYHQGDLDRAAHFLGRVTLRPSVPALAASPFFSRPHDRHLTAQIHEARGEHADAIRWYLSLTEMWDFDYMAPGHLGLARSYSASGDTATAIEHYRIAEDYWRDGERGAVGALAETRRLLGLPESAVTQDGAPGRGGE